MNTTILEKTISELLVEIGEDPSRQGLLKTPERAAKALKFLTKGYQEDLEALINGALFESTDNNMVLVRDIEFYSLCEHHLLPFFGKCHIAYLPHRHILGLSKLARIVDLFARRLQVQERLSQEIAECLLEVTQAHGVGVVIEARHMCMMMRGIEKQNSSMKTTVTLGEFKNSGTRDLFFQLLRS